MDLQKMTDGMRLFRLKNPAIGNDELAQIMGVNRYFTDEHGLPGCCFWNTDVPVVAIRVNDALIAILNVYQSIGMRLMNSYTATNASWSEVLQP